MATFNDGLSGQLNKLLSEYQNIIDAEKSEDDLLVEGYRSSIIELERLYINSPPTRPRQLTIPEIFRRSYDENFISDYLAYILDPAINGIGTQPLSILFQNLFPESQEPDFNSVEIQREYDVGGGRIDFLIQIGDSSIIGIENKLYSPEGDQQTIYYARMINKEFADYDCYFIFLTPGGAKASSSEFVSLSYIQIWDLFRTIQYDWQADVRKSIYWEDFLTHLEVYIMGQEKFEFSPRAKIYIEHFSMLDDVNKAFEQDWKKLLDLLEASIYSHIQDGDWETYFNPTRWYWHVLKKNSWNYQNLYIHYEYTFAPANLASSEFTFSFDVEGKKDKDFNKLFERHLPSLSESYEKLGIDSRPGNRKHSLASKIYKFDPPPDSWQDEFISAYDEFSFITPYIDETFKEFKSLDSKP